MTPERELSQPPVYTTTWFHTGACFERTTLLDAYAEEYYRSDVEAPRLSPTRLPENKPKGKPFNLQEEQGAWRALKGSLLRQEIYGLDNSPASQHPYKVSEYRYGLQLVQPLGSNRHVFAVTIPPDPPGPTQVLTRMAAARAFLIVRYTLAT